MNPRRLYYLVHGRKPRRAPRSAPGSRGPSRDWRYRAWIRSFPCAICGTMRNIEAAHTGHDGATSQKSSDYSAVPLCGDCHRSGPQAYHRIGRRQFERVHRIDLQKLTERLNRIWAPGKRDAA